MNSKHIGSSFDDFLKEENIYNEVTFVAKIRVMVFRFYESLFSLFGAD